MEITLNGKVFRIESIRIHDTCEGYLVGRREYLSKKILQELSKQYSEPEAPATGDVRRA